jgi:hypothetical protein
MVLAAAVSCLLLVRDVAYAADPLLGGRGAQALFVVPLLFAFRGPRRGGRYSEQTSARMRTTSTRSGARCSSGRGRRRGPRPDGVLGAFVQDVAEDGDACADGLLTGVAEAEHELRRVGIVIGPVRAHSVESD